MSPFVAQNPIQFSRITDLTNAFQNVTTTSANFYGYRIYNPNGAASFVKLSDTSSGAVGTAAVKTTITIPANTEIYEERTQPIRFDNQVRVTATSGHADSNSAAPTSDLYVEIYYKD